MSNVTIREINKDDIKNEDITSLCELGRKTFTETFAHLYKPHELLAHLDKNYDPALLRSEIECGENRISVAEIRNDAGEVEMAAFVKIGAMSLPVDDAPKGATELRQLYVLQSFHRMRLGSMLMKWAMAELTRSTTDVYLGVWSENHKAQEFYRRFGFEHVGEYKYYVGNDGHYDREFIFKLGKN